MSNSDSKQWKLTAITEALGDLELSVEDKLTVGRGQDNDVVLGSKQVSRQHAELTVVDDKLMVQDLGSSNGTLVNDHKLEPHQPTALAEQDTLTFAAFSFRVNQVAVTPTIAPAFVADEPESEVVEAEEVVEPVADVEAPTAESEPEDQTLAESNAEAEQAKQNAEAVDRAGIEGLTEAELEDKLEEELEGPIAMGDPNQESHNSKEEHFEELAAEADPEVHKAKQAAAAQLSATTNLHENVEEEAVTEPEVTEPEVTEPEVTEPEVTEPEVTEPEVTEPEVVEPEVVEPEVVEPEVVEPEVVEPEVVEPEAEKVAPATTEAPVTEEVLEESKPAPELNNSFNTVKEEPQHNVAHVKNHTPAPNTSSSGKNSTFLWMALILVGLAVALWLYNSGTLA